MENEVTTKQNKIIEYMVGDNKIKLSMKIVRDNLVGGNNNVTDQEVMSFMMLASHNKLDPFLKEVYLVKFHDKPAQMIVSKEAFMKRADSNENYDGFEAGIIVERDGQLVDEVGSIMLSTDKLIGGWAHVYRKDRSKPVISRISLKEFSKGQSTWNAMPATMIRKTAIVNALREAFPQNLGAMYTEEEQQPATDVTPTEKSEAVDLISKLSSATKRQEAVQEVPETPEPEIIEPEPLFNNFNDIPTGNGDF